MTQTDRGGARARRTDVPGRRVTRNGTAFSLRGGRRTRSPESMGGSAVGKEARMGRDVAHVVFTREDRRRFRDKHRRCLDVLAQMLAESQFDFDRPLTGMEIELNLVDDRGEPANRNARVLELVADPAFQTEMGQFNIEINVAPREIAGGGPRRVRAGRAVGPEPRRRARAHRRGAPGDDRRPADADAAARAHRGDEREPALRRPQRPDLRRPWRGHRADRRRRRAAEHLRRLDHSRGRVHELPAAPAGQPRPVRAVLERRAGDRRGAAGARRRTPRSCSARSCGARRASRCSSRPPTRAPTSSRSRGSGRACGSASGG